MQHFFAIMENIHLKMIILIINIVLPGSHVPSCFFHVSPSFYHGNGKNEMDFIESNCKKNIFIETGTFLPYIQIYCHFITKIALYFGFFFMSLDVHKLGQGFNMESSREQV